MLKSYEAIYDNGYLQWLDPPPPKLKKTRVVVVVESDDHGTFQHPSQKPNGIRLARILRDTDSELLLNMVNKFGDPVEWQREQRRERMLPGREEDHAP